MPHLAEDRLALVRQLYESSELTIAEIAVLAEISESAIYQRARREQWQTARRPGVAPRKAKLRPPLAPTAALVEAAGAEAPPEGDVAPGAVDRAVDRAATAARLWRAVNRHLEALEAEDAPDTVIRAAQNLATLARTLETLIDVERGLKAEAPTIAPDEGPEDIEEFRNEIARRLEALYGPRRADGGPAAESAGGAAI